MQPCPELWQSVYRACHGSAVAAAHLIGRGHMFKLFR
jgi:hypothetical protein